MKKLTVIWYSPMKGIGEGFDEDGVIHFINGFKIDFKKTKKQPTVNETVYLL